MKQNLSVEESLGFTFFYGAVVGLCALLTVAVLAEAGTIPAPSDGNAVAARVAVSGAAPPAFGVAS